MPTTRRAYLRSAIAGLAGFFALFVIAHEVLPRFGLRAETSYVDDILLGFLVAILVIALEAQHEWEIRVEKLRTQRMIELNHHVRNALQTIIYVNSGNPNPDDAHKVSQATQRIERALRDVSGGPHTQRPVNDGTHWTSRPAQRPGLPDSGT